MPLKLQHKLNDLSAMNQILIFPLILLIIIGIGSCGGNKVFKGIKGDEFKLPPLPERNIVDERAFSYFVNGHIFETFGNLSMANRQYAEALRYCLNCGEIRYSYALTYFYLSDFRRAITESEKISPKGVEAWLLMADSYHALGIDDSAQMAYRQAAGFNPGNITVYRNLAAYFQKENKLDSAVWAYENLARLSPGYKVFQEIGNLQLRLGNLDKARDSYLGSIALDSSENNIRSYLGLSVISENAGDQLAAKQYTETAARLSPQNVLIQNRLLGFYQENDELDKAIRTAKTVVTLAPMDKNAVRRLALTYYLADSLRAADSIFTDLLKAGDENVINYYYCGRIAYLQKDYKKAKEAFTRIAVMADSLVDAWLHLGLIYQAQDSTNEEIAVYTLALQHMRNSDDSIRIMLLLGTTLEKKGDFEHSADMFEKILALRPDHSQSLNYLGYMLAERGIKLDYALHLIEKALALQPENGAYIDSYGWILYKRGDYPAALKELLRAYQKIDDDATILNHIGDAYKALGDIPKAKLYWEKALILDPQNGNLKEKLGK